MTIFGPTRTATRRLRPAGVIKVPSKRRLQDRICEQCRREFRPPVSGSRFCSIFCCRLARRIAAQEPKPKKPPRAFTPKDIEDRSIPVPEAGCHLWLFPPTNRGYGQIGQFHRSFSAHRVAYQVFKGEIPAGMCVMHTCDTPLCVNPDHLRLGTHQENIADRSRKGRTRNRGGAKYAAPRKKKAA